jgi:hypothetical protein
VAAMMAMSCILFSAVYRVKRLRQTVVRLPTETEETLEKVSSKYLSQILFLFTHANFHPF